MLYLYKEALMRKKYTAPVPTIEHIRSLYERGDIEALRSVNETLAKRSNTRLRELEKQGFDTTAAYKRAIDFTSDEGTTSRNRFSRSKKMDIDTLYDQVKMESNFLRWQTSTPAGEIERRRRVWEGLTVQRIDAEGNIIDPVIDLSKVGDIDVFKKKFLQFLDEKAWDEIKKHIYSKNILNEAGEAISAGADIQDLANAIRDYNNNDTKDDLINIWDNWTSVLRKGNNEGNQR